jgi:tetratricopeptide (TPR) repeat protein
LNRKDTIFPIASITKTITATAILQQVEKGKIRLDDSAAKYLPDFPFPEITVRQLLSHTSGLPAYNAFFNSIVEKNPAVVFHNSDFNAGLNANKKPLIYQPGESWNYDNINFIVLALILEKVSGETYGEYVEKHILKPAGMKQTFMFPQLFDSSKNNVKNVVIPHLYPNVYADAPVRADSIKYISDYWKTYQFSGFGDFVSTTHDLLKYDEALYNGKLLGEKTLIEAFTPVKINNGKANSGNYGLGWTIALDDSLGKTVFHVGGSIGLSCIIYRNIAKHQTIIAYDIAHSNAGYIAANALKILNGQTVPLPKKKLVRLYGKLLVSKGKDAAAETLEKLSKDTANYELTKDELINLGYEFLGDLNPYRLPIKPNYDAAIEVFKQSIKLFPDYWNSYDSYADALTRTGKNDSAIEMYRKSIELNPQNEGGKKALQKLLEGKK